MPSTDKKEKSGTKNIAQEIIGYLIAVICAVILAVLIRVFILEPFIVPTPSMEPTLMVGDKVIINKLSYRFGPVKRGDIIAFRSPLEEGKDLVKRAIGIEGDRITLTSEGELYVNDEKIEEDYLQPSQDITYINQVIDVGRDEIFVMGDNRNNSFDSRFFGTISGEDVFGEMLVVYWPPSRW
ncbi:MAG: signal peptidase I [Actinobacteria bacterium]|nr:signal peptidase I [Actinomycetota bacterium]